MVLGMTDISRGNLKTSNFNFVVEKSQLWRQHGRALNFLTLLQLYLKGQMSI